MGNTRKDEALRSFLMGRAVAVFNVYYATRKRFERSTAVQAFHYFYLKYHGVETGFGDVTLYGLPDIHKEYPDSRIIIDKGVKLVSRFGENSAGINRAVVLATLERGAVIHLKKGCGLSGTVICAARQVEVGEHANIGVNCSIYDTDFHVMDKYSRRKQTSAFGAATGPVSIGTDAWIGANVMILKGVSIGDGAVVGAGSVVTHDVPADSVVAGNPATLLQAPQDTSVVMIRMCDD